MASAPAAAVICIMCAIVIVVALLDAKLYQQTEPPPASGILGLPTWSVIAAIFCVGFAGLCLFAWAPARRLALALPFVLVLVGITAFAATQSLANLGPEPCYELNSVNVGNLQSFSGQYGSIDGPEWINILTDGVTERDPADRLAIARAVDQNSASAAEMEASLPPSLQSAVAKLVAVAGSPKSEAVERSSATVRADIHQLSAYAFQTCGDSG